MLATAAFARCSSLVTATLYSWTLEDPKKRDGNDMPKVIVCASCTATSGQLLRYSKRYAPARRFAT